MEEAGFEPLVPRKEEMLLRVVKDAARVVGVQAHPLEARTAAQIDTAFETLAALQVGALVVSADTFSTSQRAQIVTRTARHPLSTYTASSPLPAG
jgi:hypothetical protein